MIISIILPIYNEEENIPIIYKEIKEIFDCIKKYDYEIIFINDGSSDSSWQKILDLANQNKNVKGFCFSKNFGQQLALKAGYDFAVGDAIITMDSDLQHPTILIPRMIMRWESGVDIVYVRRINRTDEFLKKYTSRLFFKILDRISNVSIPSNVGEFRLIDKKVLNELKKIKSHSPYFRGAVPWTGFRSSFIDVEYAERTSGKTGYTWCKLFKLAIDGIVSLSSLPLKIAAVLGFFIVLSGMFMFAYIGANIFINNVKYPLFKLLVAIIYIFIGVLFMLIWVLGEYIGRIYEETKNYPLYIVSNKVNVDDKKLEKK